MVYIVSVLLQYYFYFIYCFYNIFTIVFNTDSRNMASAMSLQRISVLEIMRLKAERLTNCHHVKHANVVPLIYGDLFTKQPLFANSDNLHI